MESPTLTATTRDTLGKKVKQLRFAGDMPVVLYGAGAKTQHLTVNIKEFTKVQHAAGSTLVDLVIDGKKPAKVLIQDLQHDPVTGDTTHADFLQVKLDEKIQTEIPLTFVGESAAVKDLEGNLVTTKDAIKVEAYPQDLLSEIEVDISSIATFDDKITIADIKVPSTITILDDLEETLAVVTPPRTEEELEAELAPTTDEAEAAAVAATEEASTEKSEDEEKSEE
jgi:large subunit ribosomal protein L25